MAVGGATARAAAPSAQAQAVAAPDVVIDPAPWPKSFREVAALVATRREPTLHAHILHSVHLVRFAPPVLELRVEPEAPRDLAARLAGLLLDATGVRWTIALSTAEGEPTLAAQGGSADAARRASAAEHPMVRAILDAFPGARIAAVHDRAADAYGLPAEPAPLLDSRVADVFAPDDAAFVDDLDDAPAPPAEPSE